MRNSVLDMLSLRCLLETHLEMLNRKLIRDSGVWKSSLSWRYKFGNN